MENNETKQFDKISDNIIKVEKKDKDEKFNKTHFYIL